MVIKVILALLGGTESDERALRTAFGLAQLYEAHVEALHVRIDPRTAMPYMGEGMSGAAIQEILESAEKDEESLSGKLQKLFASLCTEGEIPLSDTPSNGVSAAWVEEIGREDEIVSRRGRLADLILVGRPGKNDEPSAGLTIETALFESGRPVMIIPPGPLVQTGRKIAVAWNGSLEATRAVAGAMPVLRRADEVTVFSVIDKDDGEGPDGLVRYLGWNGVSAQAQTIDSKGRPAGRALLEEVSQWQGDLLVMGGYTHNRFRQMLFGGVTRHIMTDAPIPVLMTH
ncbi:MAG: universal stress protein [Rhodospirillaceae bacterium]|nr:universal stress protein [Rhodospirillaceae bacterium]